MKRIEDSEKRKLEIAEESGINEEAGQRLAAALAAETPQEVERFRGHVSEVETVTCLLLCLAARLARTEGDQGQVVEAKRTRLLQQLEEAKGLKVRIDRRGEVVGRGVEEVLGEGRRKEYWAFLRSKERLVVERREVEERLRLARDQLRVIQ